MDLQVEVSRSCSPHEEDFFCVLKTTFSSNHKFLTELHCHHWNHQIPGCALLPGTCRASQLSGHTGCHPPVPPQLSQPSGLPAAHTALHIMTSLSCRLGPPSNFQHALYAMAMVLLCQAGGPLAWLNSGLAEHELWQTPLGSWRMEYQKVHYYLWMQDLSSVSVLCSTSHPQTSQGFFSWVLLLRALLCPWAKP